MKLLLFSGTHPRHLYVNNEILKHFKDVLVIVMQRENLLPSPCKSLSKLDKKLFIKHFKNRKKAEDEAYGKLNYKEVFKNVNTIFITPQELNTVYISEKVKDYNADLSFIFGVDLILDPVISNLPKNKINLHLGLSPWYKGGATLFWPFYLLKPQFCGVTFHQITPKPDDGEIIHQSVPTLNYGDNIHDVGVKCVIQAKNDIKIIINQFKSQKKFVGYKQKTTGRIWRGKDFNASHLRLIYDYYNDKIVDKYLDGLLGNETPIIHKLIES